MSCNILCFALLINYCEKVCVLGGGGGAAEVPPPFEPFRLRFKVKAIFELCITNHCAL